MANQDVRISIKAVDKTRAGFASVTKGLKSVAGAVFSMKSAIASAVGIGGIGLMIQQSLKATDALAKTATRIGTTTEALSKLHFAADLTGVSTDTMNMALQRFTRRTSEAARGTGEARGALRDLNLNAEHLLRLPLDEQMIKLAQAFEENIDPVNRTATAMKLFDSEGVALLQTLDGGAKGLREMFTEAELLGLVMDDKLAAGVTEANDSITRLFAGTRGLVRQFTAALAPAITAVVTEWHNYVAGLAEAEGGFKNLALTFATDVVSALQQSVQSIANVVNSFIRGFNAIKEAYAGFMEFIGKGDGTFEVTAEIDVSGFIAKLEKAKDKITNIKHAVEEVEQATVQATKPSLWAQFTEAAGGALQNIRDEIGSTQQTFQAMEKTVEDIATKGMKDLTDGLYDAAASTKTLGEAFRKMAAGILEDLTKMIIRYFIVRPLFGAITGGASNVASPAIRGRAAIGGPVQAGSPYMVGERGPEMFIPNSSGSIVPNDKMGGGITVVNNVNASGAGPEVDLKIRAAMQETSQQTILSIQDLMRRRRFV